MNIIYLKYSMLLHLLGVPNYCILKWIKPPSCLSLLWQRPKDTFNIILKQYHWGAVNLDGDVEVEPKNHLKVMRSFVYTMGKMLVILAKCSSGLVISIFSHASISALFPSHHESCVFTLRMANTVLKLLCRILPKNVSVFPKKW